MSKDEVSVVREAVAKALGNLGEQSLPILEKMSKDENLDVRKAAIQARIKIIVESKGEQSLPILEKMSKDEVDAVRKAAKTAIAQLKKGGYKYLLSTQKPLFATPETKVLAERIKKLQEIAQKLKEKFKDKFIGITILGGMAKGYLREESDLDWGIIAKDKKVSEEFQKIAKSLNLCHEHYAEVSKKNEVLKNKDVLFYGLFFGDHKELRKLQKIAFQNMDKNEWDDIRRHIMINETNLFKAAERFNINEEEMERLCQFATLLRVPPSYNEALEIVKKRAD
jgi:predicted nucleotidyltransferase